jgi:hypothetical protein
LLVGHVYSYQCTWIEPPHRKMGVIVSERASWICWFNSDARFHGIAQMEVAEKEHQACTRDCFLDLSQVQQVRLDEQRGAVDEGLISAALRQRILDALANPNPLLPDLQRHAILRNLAP